MQVNHRDGVADYGTRRSQQGAAGDPPKPRRLRSDSSGKRLLRGFSTGS